MSLKRCSVLLFAAVVCLSTSPAAVASIIVGHVDDFEDGTTEGWVINLLGMGSPPPEALPQNVPTGGPGGAGDHFLQLTSLGGEVPGGRLVAINLGDAWTGDYLAAGVNEITMSVNNFGSSDLALRILLEHAEGGPPTDIAFSNDPVLVPAGSGWRTVTFAIGADDLTALVGSVGAVLSDVNVIRIFHSPLPGFPGPPVQASLGVDNITATAVPEPSSLALSLIGLAILGAVARPFARRSPS